MSIIELLVMTIILVFFTIIVYYFIKKEYREHNNTNTFFFIGMSILFFISMALSFLDIKNQYLVYIYLFATSGALLVNQNLNKFFNDNRRKAWTVLYLLYLFSILVFLQFDNYVPYLTYSSKFLIILYFLDVSLLVSKSDKINNLHKMFFAELYN